MKNRKIGKLNSSITRVRPVFQRLLEADSSGQTWLPEMLGMNTCNQELAVSMSADTGNLLPEIVTKRSYKDRVLQTYGIGDISLEKCFEKSLPPPEKFLGWLINNHERLNKASLDDSKIGSSNSESENMRRDLFGPDGPAKDAATAMALAELRERGGKGSYRKWWAFEGFTEVDCYLETEKLVLLIEGKRTEPLSSATMWYPRRNQIVRNLEVAREVATTKGKEYGVLLIGEESIPFDLNKEAAIGLPHLEPEERDQISGHYLGCVTWEAVCCSTGISFSDIPDTTEEVAKQLR